MVIIASMEISLNTIFKKSRLEYRCAIITYYNAKKSNV